MCVRVYDCGCGVKLPLKGGIVKREANLPKSSFSTLHCPLFITFIGLQKRCQLQTFMRTTLKKRKIH